MLTKLLCVLDWAQLRPWGVPTVGLVSTALAFVVGRLLLGRRRTPGPPAPLGGTASLQTDPFLQGGVSERRQALRRPGKPIKVIITDARTQTECWDGWVIDRSLSGICLSMPQEMRPGVMLSVRAESADRSCWVPMEVRHCRFLENRWAVGCKFAPATPWGHLLTFG